MAFNIQPPCTISVGENQPDPSTITALLLRGVRLAVSKVGPAKVLLALASLGNEEEPSEHGDI
jgi:hypothetical protein